MSILLMMLMEDVLNTLREHILFRNSMLFVKYCAVKCSQLDNALPGQLLSRNVIISTTVQFMLLLPHAPVATTCHTSAHTTVVIVRCASRISSMHRLIFIAYPMYAGACSKVDEGHERHSIIAWRMSEAALQVPVCVGLNYCCTYIHIS